MAATIADNRYIPLDAETITRRRRRENASFLPERKDRWKKFKMVCAGKFVGPIASMDFAPRPDGNTGSGFTLAIAGSTRVDLHHISPWSGDDMKQKREIMSSKMYTRFKNFVRCVSIRDDGKLISAVDESGVAQLFDAHSRSQLRKMTGHSGAIHSCAFSKNNVRFFATGGDDAALRVWDISDGSCRFEVPNAHQDTIACVVADPVLQRPSETLVFATGGFDGYVKLWRFHLNDGTHECVLKFLHGESVGSLAFFPEGALLVSAGGPDVKVWDITGGGKLVHSFQSHVKTVTAVSVARDGSYITTGSLDQTVKLHCSSRFTVLHSMSLDDAVTHVKAWTGPSGEELLGIGLSDGQWILRQRVSAVTIGTLKNAVGAKRLKSGTANPGQQRRFFRRGLEVEPHEDDVLIQTSAPKRFALLDKLLQGFNYQLSLDCAVKQQDGTGLALIDSLIEKGALHIAVRGKTEATILPLLAFIHREFGKDSTSTPILLEFTHTLLAENSWISSSKNHLVTQALQRVSSKLELDISEHQILRELSGLAELIQASTASSA